MTLAAKHVIKVRVVRKPGGWELDVDQKFNDHHIPHGVDPQLISWQILDAGNHNYRFVEMTHNPPGFSWKEPASPSPDIFSTPQVCPDCGHLTMTDLNDGNSSMGEFIYQLRVWVGDEIVATAYVPGVLETDPFADVTDPAQKRFIVTTNPRIKNT
jgi:hypothetical protein